MVLLLALVLLIPHCGNASRRQSRGGNGRIANLISFAAPRTADPPLTGADGACLPGYRVVQYQTNRKTLFNPQGLDSEDGVPKLFSRLGKHPHVTLLALHTNTDNALKGKWDCVDGPTESTRSDLALHEWRDYVTNVERLDDSFARVKAAGKIGIFNSYDLDVVSVKSNLQGSGWNLVGRAVFREDVSHLMQEQNTKRCILTFEGSDSIEDWVKNFNVGKVTFCGIPGVHGGFKAELMSMVNSEQYQQQIRPKLGKCKEVDVVGHSLGGAVASLFAACIEGQQISSSHYTNMSWHVSVPELMDSI